MRLDFDPSEDSQAQAYILVGALSEWLKENPSVQPPRPGRARFVYRPDGSLDSVNIVLIEDGEE